MENASCSLSEKPVETALAKPLSELGQKLSTLIGLDLNSLAAFRICLGFLLIADMIRRGMWLAAHYTDWGVMPREAIVKFFSADLNISLFMASGSWTWAFILFIVTGVFAFFLMIGFKTRWMAFFCWFLTISLHTRNPLVLQGGDVFLRVIMFWAMFLPLGARFSVDSALATNPKDLEEPRILNMATVAFTLQVCFMYWFTAILKDHPIWNREGTAVYYALNLDQFGGYIAQFLLQYPDLLRLLTFSTYALEGFGAFLLFIPFYTNFFRTLCVFSFIGMHAGFGAALAIGNFTFIPMLGWLALLPTGFWKALPRFFGKKQKNVTVFFDADCGFCQKMVNILKNVLILPFIKIKTAQEVAEVNQMMVQNNSWVVKDHHGAYHYGFNALATLFFYSPIYWPFSFLMKIPGLSHLGELLYKKVAENRFKASKISSFLTYKPIKTRLGFVAQYGVLILLIYVLFWNLRTLDFKKYEGVFPKSMNPLADLLRIDQMWNMFAPFPLKDDGWYVIPGKLRDNTEVNLFDKGKPVTWEKPKWVVDTYPEQRWRKYMMNLWQKKYSDQRLYYGRYLCRDWNSKHFDQKTLETFQIYFMKETTLPDYKTPKIEKVLLWSHDCFKRDEPEKKKKETPKITPKPVIKPEPGPEVQ